MLTYNVELFIALLGIYTGRVLGSIQRELIHQNSMIKGWMKGSFLVSFAFFGK